MLLIPPAQAAATAQPATTPCVRLVLVVLWWRSAVSSEQVEYDSFLANGKLIIPDDDPWLVRVRNFRRTGRWIGRVHVISRPLADYLRYEFAVYQFTAQAGEDVCILDLAERRDPGLPPQDFWLFDDTAVVRMDFLADGTQVGRELLEGVDPAPYVAWKRLALEYWQPFMEYAKLHECK